MQSGAKKRKGIWDCAHLEFGGWPNLLPALCFPVWTNNLIFFLKLAAEPPHYHICWNRWESIWKGCLESGAFYKKKVVFKHCYSSCWGGNNLSFPNLIHLHNLSFVLWFSVCCSHSILALYNSAVQDMFEIIGLTYLSSCISQPSLNFQHPFYKL